MVALTQTPFAGLVLVAPILAFANEIGEYIPFELPEIDEPTGGVWLFWFVPLLLVAGFALSIVLNLIRVLLSDWNLTIRRTSAGLRREAGLLSTVSVAATIPRVQIVRISQGLLERFASLRTVTLATIGSSNFVVPGCDVHQAADVRSLALAGSDGVDRLDRMVSPTEVFLRTRNTAIVVWVLIVVLWWSIGWWAFGLIVFVPWVWATTRRRVRLRRWGVGTDALADRRELVGWQRSELLIRKANGVTLRQSLFERKRELGTVIVQTAAGSVSIGMIPIAQACELRDQILFQVETDHRPWM